MTPEERDKLYWCSEHNEARLHVRPGVAACLSCHREKAYLGLVGHRKITSVLWAQAKEWRHTQAAELKKQEWFNSLPVATIIGRHGVAGAHYKITGYGEALWQFANRPAKRAFPEMQVQDGQIVAISEARNLPRLFKPVPVEL